MRLLSQWLLVWQWSLIGQSCLVRQHCLIRLRCLNWQWRLVWLLCIKRQRRLPAGCQELLCRTNVNLESPQLTFKRSRFLWLLGFAGLLAHLKMEDVNNGINCCHSKLHICKCTSNAHFYDIVSTAAALPWSAAWVGTAPLRGGLEEAAGEALLRASARQLQALPLAQGGPRGGAAAQEAAGALEGPGKWASTGNLMLEQHPNLGQPLPAQQACS